MWKIFQTDGDFYLIKVIKEDGIKVCMSDMKLLWSQSFSKEEVLSEFQVLNPILDVKIEAAIDEVFNMIENIPILANIEFNKNSDFVTFKLKDKKAGFDLFFNLNLKQESAENFLKEFTIPLIQSMKLLEEQQKALCNIIQRKDRELDQYKLESAGPLSRDDLVTREFDETKLEEAQNQFESSFWDHFQQKHGKITTKLEVVPIEPWNNVKRKRTVYSSKTVKKRGQGVNFE